MAERDRMPYQSGNEIMKLKLLVLAMALATLCMTHIGCFLFVQ